MSVETKPSTVALPPSMFLPAAGTIHAGKTVNCVPFLWPVPCLLITALVGDFLMPVVWIWGEVRASKRRPQYEMLSALALAAVLHTVKPGDTLSGIPQHYDTSWEAVYDHKQSTIQSSNLIYGDLAKAHPSVQAATTEPSSGSSGSGYGSSALGDVPGVPYAFAACVAYRESTNDTNPAADGNAYGIIPASGYNVSGDSIAQQKLVFKQIYDTSGPAAWAADGCPGT
jgi:hypothetical protein